MKKSGRSDVPDRYAALDNAIKGDNDTFIKDQQQVQLVCYYLFCFMYVCIDVRLTITQQIINKQDEDLEQIGQVVSVLGGI